MWSSFLMDIKSASLHLSPETMWFWGGNRSFGEKGGGLQERTSWVQAYTNIRMIFCQLKAAENTISHSTSADIFPYSKTGVYNVKLIGTVCHENIWKTLINLCTMAENKQTGELQPDTQFCRFFFFPSKGEVSITVYALVMYIWKAFIYTGWQKCWWSLAWAVLCNFGGAAQFSRSSC